jgi:hypothetical protein
VAASAWPHLCSTVEEVLKFTQCWGAGTSGGRGPLAKYSGATSCGPAPAQFPVIQHYIKIFPTVV